MTHKQQKALIYGLAAFVIALSFLFWTKMAGAAAPIKSPTRWDVSMFLMNQGKVWMGALETTGEVRDQFLVAYAAPFPERKASRHSSPIADLFNGMVAIEEKVQEVIKEEPKKEYAPLTDDSELEQWELRRAYTVSIPSIGVRAPVLIPSMRYWSAKKWDVLEKQMQVGLSNGTVVYPHSARPGATGTIFVSGHSSPPDERAMNSAFGSVFARVPEVAIGETITIGLPGDPVKYRVTDKKVVLPNHTSMLEQQDDDSVLKLITCYPVGTTKQRMIVTAEIVEE